MVPRLHRGKVLVDVVFMFLVSVIFALHARLGCGGRDKWCPLKITPTGRPHVAALFVKGKEARNK